MTKYPANDDGQTYRPCDAYDPREKVFMKSILEKTVNYVVILDNSASIWNHYLGIKIIFRS